MGILNTLPYKISNMKLIFLGDYNFYCRLFINDALIELTIPILLIQWFDAPQLKSNFKTAEKPTPPDVTFLDLNKPCKNGLEWLQEIRNSLKIKVILSINFLHQPQQSRI